MIGRPSLFRSLCERDFSLRLDGDASSGSSILSFGFSCVGASGERVTIVVRRGRACGGVPGRTGESGELRIDGMVGIVVSVKLLDRVRTVDLSNEFCTSETSSWRGDGEGDGDVGAKPLMLADVFNEREASSPTDVERNDS